MQTSEDRTPENSKQGRVDWEAMDPHWRAGIVSIQALSKEFGVNRSAIRKHFAKLGIERDLRAEIKGEANSLVLRAEVNGGQLVPAAAPAAPGSTKETVGVNARIQAEVILRHRFDIKRAQRVTGQLLTELESQTFDATLYQRLDALMRKAGASGKVSKESLAELTSLYARTTTTSSRTENMRKLSEIMKVLVELERKVHGIAEDTPVDPEERVKEAVASGLSELKARFSRHLSLVPAAA